MSKAGKQQAGESKQQQVKSTVLKDDIKTKPKKSKDDPTTKPKKTFLEERTKLMSKRMNDLAPKVASSPNNVEWNKLIDYIQKRVDTFDESSGTFTNYETKSAEKESSKKNKKQDETV
jgi:hypothetical protein